MAERDVALTEAIASGSALDRWLAVLSDGDRRELIRHLASGTTAHEATIGELAFAIGVSRFSASRHVQVLRQVGLVVTRKVGNRVLVHLVDEPLRIIDDWVGGVVDALATTA
ncbi:transcriptional regulator [Microbacterium faecale]|uniref:Transcriptional regulator n=1 Tax=Microbacterium faecale TaxID=1804630 RepID=A0A917DG04_9MICO|nr:metalloregulator ArsR/SmtB family transcription factor [Microbacterium faecale]GGD32741.1 transcriptional regulator [Microbacterium faecale]